MANRAPAQDKASPAAKARAVFLTAKAFTLEAPLSTPLSLLVAALAREFAGVMDSLGGVALDRHQPAASFSPMDARVRGLIGDYLRGGHDDWRAFVGFNPLHYVRHLIDGNDDFELMLICWETGQGSRVHDHADSHCWLTALDGTVEELRYIEEGAADGASAHAASLPDIPGVVGPAQACPVLRPAGVAAVAPGGTAYINDSMGLHAVRCPADCPAPGAVTLHLYCPPIRRVKLYEPEAGRVVQRVPGFFSVRGKRT